MIKENAIIVPQSLIEELNRIGRDADDTVGAEDVLAEAINLYAALADKVKDGLRVEIIVTRDPLERGDWPIFLKIPLPPILNKIQEKEKEKI